MDRTTMAEATAVAFALGVAATLLYQRVAAAGAPPRPSAQPVTPIPISAGFEQAFTTEDGVDADLNPVIRRHATLGAEARDAAWADATERDIDMYLREYLDQHGIDRHAIELPVVRCGTTLCEIQAVGQADGSPRDWQSALPQLMQASLGQDFQARNAVTSAFELPNGQAGYVSFLSRKPNQEKAGADAVPTATPHPSP